MTWIQLLILVNNIRFLKYVWKNCLTSSRKKYLGIKTHIITGEIDVKNKLPLVVFFLF